MTTTREVESFANNKSMWYGFAGCTIFPKTDEEPVYAYINDWLVIADGEGVQCSRGSDTEDDELIAFDMNIEFPNALCAMAFLKGLPDDFEPEQFNAIRIL